MVLRKIMTDEPSKTISAEAMSNPESDKLMLKVRTGRRFPLLRLVLHIYA